MEHSKIKEWASAARKHPIRTVALFFCALFVVAVFAAVREGGSRIGQTFACPSWICTADLMSEHSGEVEVSIAPDEWLVAPDSRGKALDYVLYIPFEDQRIPGVIPRVEIIEVLVPLGAPDTEGNLYTYVDEALQVTEHGFQVQIIRRDHEKSNVRAMVRWSARWIEQAVHNPIRTNGREVVKLSEKKQSFLEGKLFDVEHGINMHATNFFYLPAAEIYNYEALKPYENNISRCHIYVIGFVPRVDFVNASQKGRDLILTYEILENSYDLVWELPPSASLSYEDKKWYVSDGTENRYFPKEIECLNRLHNQFGVMNFHVKYIGQSYGKDGSSSAYDRLLKHETLQKIALKGAPKGYRVELLLVEVEPNNQIITMFNPFAEDIESGDSRIVQGLDKLFHTSEKERVALYEAAMIRYFYPEFNTTFKDSFPSTNLKVLQDCYDKDFSSVSAELVIDDLPIALCSETIEPSSMHFAQHDLHTDKARKVFFKK